MPKLTNADKMAEKATEPNTEEMAVKVQVEEKDNQED